MNTFALPLSLFVLTALALAARADDAKTAKDDPMNLEYLRLHAETRGFMLGRPVKPKPTPDGKAVLFLRSEAKSPKLSLFEFDVASGKARMLLTPEEVLKGGEESLSAEEKARRERMRVTVGGFTDYQLDEEGKQVLLSLSGKLFVYNRTPSKLKLLATGKGTLLDPKFSPDGKQVAYVLDHDVYVYDLASDKEQRVTTGGTEKKPHGLAEFVAQEEMGRFSGYWWSPDGKQIAYQETDHDGVEVWNVADPAKPDQAPSKQYYPRPGKQNATVRLGIIPVSGGETVWVEWDAKRYEYLASARWDEHGPLTVTVQNRLQQELALLKVDPKTGKTTVLLKETDKTFINLDQEMPRWLKNGDFLWASDEKTGRRLSRRQPGDHPVLYITPPSLNYVGLVRVIEKEEGKVICQVADEPIGTRAAFFDLAERKGDWGWENSEPPVWIGKNRGVDTVIANKDGSVCVLTSTSQNTLPSSEVLRFSGGKGRRFLPEVAAEPPFRPNVVLVNMGAFYASIVRPLVFDKKKKYPILLYVYGGPRHRQVEGAMGRWLLPQWIADRGFIVVAIDNRGTPGRGHEWEHAIYGKFGSVPLGDQVGGLQALGEKFPELDLDRVGVYGWSFGGYLSALAVLRRPDVFKAAIAGAPVVDWEDYDTHYTERYMGLPKDNPEAYKEASLLTYAAKLERPLLLVHGTADDNVYFRHSLKLADALFREGKDFEMLPLSGLTHQLPDPVVTQRLYSRFVRFFQKHLGKPVDRKG
jgi:dipeptidyl-peptidase-4